MNTTTKRASYKLKTVAIEIVCEGNAVVGGSINGSHQAALIARGMIGNAMKEHFVALHLDNQNRVVSTETISIGTMNASLVHPRETFRAALIAGAASIIVAHNHPSGDTTPSDEDRRVTERLAAAARILGVNLLDHLIVTNSTAYYSFADAGALVRGNNYRGNQPDLDVALGETPAPYGQPCQYKECSVPASRTMPNGWAMCDAHAALVENHATLVAIVDAMSGREWGADTLDEIVSILRGAGYEIDDVDDDTLQDHDSDECGLDPVDDPAWVLEAPAPYLTSRTVRVGRVVALADPVSFACRFFCKELGGIVGAGGRLLPRDLIDQPAVVWSCGTPRSRVLIAWDNGDLGAWVDVGMLRTIEQEPSTVQETPLRYSPRD